MDINTKCTQLSIELNELRDFIIKKNETCEDYDSVSIECMLRTISDQLKQIKEINKPRFQVEAMNCKHSIVQGYLICSKLNRNYDYSKIAVWNYLNNSLQSLLVNKKNLENELRQNIDSPNSDESNTPTVTVKEITYLLKTGRR
jgi:hypothetical protein